MTRTVLDEEGRPADRTSKTLKPTKTIWVTKEGQRIRVRDMADSHLLNTIKMLRRSAGERHTNAIITGYSVLNFLQGEMAILSVEQDLAKLGELYT